MKSKINQLKIGVVLTYLQTILNAIISIGYTPIMLRLLGQNEYGVYTMSSSMISYLGLLNFGLNSSYVRFYMRYKKEDNEKGLAQLNGIIFVVYFGIAMIALLAGLEISRNVSWFYGNTLNHDELKIASVLMAMLSFNLAMTFICTVFASYVTANEQFVFQKLLNMGKTVLSPLITIPVLLMGGRSVGMVVVTTLVGISVDIANIVFCLKKLDMKFAIKDADFRLIGEIGSYSVFIAINSIVDQINWQVDKVILGHYHGANETAIYGVASQLNTVYINISTAVSAVFIPRVHKIIYLEDSKKQFDDLFIKIGRIQMLILGLIGSGLILFGEQFICFWAGSSYKNAYPIVLLLVLPGTIALIQNIGIEIQRARNMHRFRSWVYLIMAVINLLVSIPLGKKWGGIGCAIGTAVSLLVANGIIMNWFYAKKMNMDILAFWKSMLKIIRSVFLVSIIGLILLQCIKIYSIFILCLCIIIYSLFYFITCWNLSMNQYEKQLIESIIRKVLRR